MRIAFFVPRCTPDNSHGRYVIELAQRMAGRHEVEVFAGAVWAPLRRDVRCRWLPVPNRPTVLRLASLWPASIALTWQRRFDIVHTQGADAPVGNVILAPCCNAALQGIVSGPKPPWARATTALGIALERRCLTKPQAGRIIAVSRKVKRDVEEHYGVAGAKLAVIPYGINVDQFHPRNTTRWREVVRARHGLGPDRFVIVYVGGNYRLKGFLPLVEAVAHLDRRTAILAVGIVPDRGLVRCLEQARVADRVIFPGARVDVAPYYAAADCFVLPTLYDTFSMATMEAMASGLPVIVSNEAGISELLTDGRDALILEDPSDREGLRETIARLMTSESLRRDLGAAARRTAEQYSWDQIVDRTLDVYQTVLAAA